MTSEAKKTLPLANYHLLGRSGLRVSPLCLGTMGFGNKWQFTGYTEQDKVEEMLDYYVSQGGNFIDTANKYQEGQSEEWLGQWMTKRGNRNDLVIASKYSLTMKEKSINSAGNSRKNMMLAIEESLRRLNTHYLDIYYVHFWDFSTPVDEIMRGLDDLVRSGKVNYVAISDAPAWQVARCNTMAELRGWNKFIGYQGKYHLGERDMERDIIPMSREMGLELIPWAVLGQGKYTGKYKRDAKPEDAARSGVNMSERDYLIADEVVKIAGEANRTPSQVALNWVRQQRSFTPIIGTRTLDQMKDNIGAMDWTLSDDQIARLNEVSKFELGFPHNFIGQSIDACPYIKLAGQINSKH